ncbi:tetratricopeptide repeat protein, partial [Acinetobacter baumannii]
MNPARPAAYLNLGVDLDNSGDAAGALNCYNTAIFVDPQYPEAYFNRAYIWSSRHEYQKAFDDLTRF